MPRKETDILSIYKDKDKVKGNEVKTVQDFGGIHESTVVIGAANSVYATYADEWPLNKSAQ